MEEFRRASGFGEAMTLFDENPLPWVLEVTPQQPAGESIDTAAAGLTEWISAQDGVDFVQADFKWLQRLTRLLALGTRLPLVRRFAASLAAFYESSYVLLRPRNLLVALAIPVGLEGQVRPRSGLAIKHGIGCPNAPGTIDSDYRGELKVLMINLGSEPVSIGRGDRIAQLLIAPVARASSLATGGSLVLITVIAAVAVSHWPSASQI